MKHNFSKILYMAFILLGAYYSIFKHDYLEAGATFGIALAFDPFDQKVAWNARPIWQRGILIMHLIGVITLFLIGFLEKNN
jgi:hypothetical protein